MSDLKRLQIHKGKLVQTERDEDDDLDSFDALSAPEAEANVFVPEPTAFSSELAALVSPSIEEKARASQPPAPSEEEEAKIDLSRVAGVAPPPPASGSVPPPPAVAAGSAASPASTPPAPIASPVSSPPAAGRTATGTPSAPPSAASGAFPVGTAVAASASPRDLFASPPPVAPAPAQAPAPAPSRGLDDDLEALMASRSFGPSAAFTGAAKKLIANLARAPRWTWVAIGGFVGGVVMTALFLGGKEADTDATAASAAAQTAPAASPVYPQPGGSTATGSVNSSSIGEQAYGSKGDRSRYGASDGYRRRGPRRRGTYRGDDGERTVRAGTAPETGSSENNSIDSLLDSALGSGSGAETKSASSPAGKSSAASSGAGLSLMPSRQEVSQAMSEVLSDVRRCAGGRSGVVTADVTVRGNGLVSSAHIRGAPFARTPAGRCMERAIRGARFPRFGKSVFRVTYPFRI